MAGRSEDRDDALLLAVRTIRILYQSSKYLSVMLSLGYELAVGAFILALIIAIVVWTIVFIEYRRLVRQRKIDRLIKRIRERTEDSGNERGGYGGIIHNGGSGASWAFGC